MVGRERGWVNRRVCEHRLKHLWESKSRMRDGRREGERLMLNTLCDIMTGGIGVERQGGVWGMGHQEGSVSTGWRICGEASQG